eukprot:TRINITY_DN824_c0_g3_i1.p1 TRINITY_DN824_c0_g3~~TRINITY_DN824_c0_g3_i1.p1  ORF type:complete len:675 (-),score=312.37 TRINITY_DN824_c0_g3_i1:105-2129(-)
MSTKNKRDNEGNNKNNDNDKGGQVDEGLNIDETNKLRIQLGLKPLYTTNAVVETKMEDEVPDPKITQQIKQELENKKKEREYKNALKGKKLGEEIEDESVSSWISKMKKRALEKEAEFEEEEEKMDNYLIGRDDEKYRVFHDMSDINEGEDVILNLKDQNVMDEDEDEEVALVNDSINTKEKDRRNKELKKKKPVYNPYDEGKSILSQYDEEKGPSSFVIENKEEEAEERKRKIRESLKMEQRKEASKPNSNVGSKIASDYYNEEEMSSLFKPKKKKANRKKNTENEKSEGRNKRNQVLEMLKKQKQEEKQNEVKEEIKKEEMKKEEGEVEEKKVVVEIGSKPRESLRERERRYQRTVKKALLKASNQPIEDEMNDELYETLSKSRKRKNIEQIKLESNSGGSVVNVAETILQRKNKQKMEKKEKKEKEKGKGLTFTSTTEFVRGLEVEDFPEEVVQIKKEKEEEDVKPVVKIKKEENVNDNVPSIIEKDDKMDESGDEEVEDDNDSGGLGLASVLNMLKKKGEGKDDSLLVASRFSDPTYIKKEIYSFEEDGIDLRKFDEFNRLLTPKEAFRDLSHRFHGKGSGKTKSEKRLRKYHQQLQMNRIQSSENKERILDNVLDYQKKSGKAYVQLTLGSNAMQELTKQTGDELSKKLEENLKKKVKKENSSKKQNNK